MGFQISNLKSLNAACCKWVIPNSSHKAGPLSLLLDFLSLFLIPPSSALSLNLLALLSYLLYSTPSRLALYFGVDVLVCRDIPTLLSCATLYIATLTIIILYFSVHSNWGPAFHTRDWEPVTITIQALLSFVGKGGAGPSSLHIALEGLTEYVNARWMRKSAWIPTWHQMDHVTWSLGLFSNNHLLEVGLTQKPANHGTLNVHNRWFIMREDLLV